MPEGRKRRSKERRKSGGRERHNSGVFNLLSALTASVCSWRLAWRLAYPPHQPGWALVQEWLPVFNLSDKSKSRGLKSKRRFNMRCSSDVIRP